MPVMPTVLLKFVNAVNFLREGQNEKEKIQSTAKLYYNKEQYSVDSNFAFIRGDITDFKRVKNE